MKLLKQLLVVSRPISWPNTAYPFAAGYIVVQQAVDLRLVLGTLFFLIPYNLLMYGVNDVFDYESDLRNPRKGGIEGAAAAKALHRPILIAAALTTLPFVVYLLLQGSLLSKIVLIVVLFFVLAYSVVGLRFKERPLLDSFTSSCHFVGPLVYALVLSHAAWSGIWLVLAFFCWGMASHAFGAVQDIVPDRQGGIASIATVLGGRWTVRFAIGLYTAACLLLIPYGWPTLLYILVGFSYIINIWPYRSISDAESEAANAAWRRFIYLNLCAGFLATLLLIYIFGFQAIN